MLRVLLLAATIAGDTARLPSVTVIGIDRSGSAYPMLATALYEAARWIAQMGPGDDLRVRWISASSYAASEEVIHIQMPAAPRVCRNTMDLACRNAYSAWQTSAQAVRREAATRLLAMKPAVAHSTDIAGYLAAAGEILNDLPAANRTLVVITDSYDTRRQAVSPDLRGIGVVIATLQLDDDVARSAKARLDLAAFFRERGASTVMVRRAEGRSK
jgi:hypothetical protein